MSSDIVWLITRNNSSFLVKRNGIQLSKEAGNLYNKQNLKLSGTNPKSINIAAAEKGVTVTFPTSKGKRSTTLKGNVRQSASAIRNIVKKAGRADLVAAALARVSRIIASQKPAKVVKPKKVRSKKN